MSSSLCFTRFCLLNKSYSNTFTASLSFLNRNEAYSGQYVEIVNAILHDPSPQGAIVVLDALDDCEEETR